MQPTAAMQRIDIRRFLFKRRGIEAICLGSIARLMRGERAAQQARRVARGVERGIRLP
jgi:hypothetical protein